MTNPMPPLILVTNDDGVHAPGIKALADALAERGEVYVVAPDREVSACAQSLTLKHPLRVEKVSERVFAVDGTPADCVNLAIVKVLPRRPELVVSGINRGPNLGEDVFYSGTVGGAREGSFFGVPAIAMSLVARAEADYTAAAAFASVLAAQVLEKGLPERTILNVNVPSGEPTGAVITVQGRRQHEGTVLEGLDPRRRTYYWIEEGKDQWAKDDMSDIHAIRRGLISVTPLHNDTTHHAVLAAFRAWEPTLMNGHGAPLPAGKRK
ncbi:MAG TPA: 5'/3'-nucleotidase SurE [Thermoanaerobaculia bacterium]|nr:5'/3'-nucleotidase SurE [Thermoanaerobaculia bacterium]